MSSDWMPVHHTNFPLCDTPCEKCERTRKLLNSNPSPLLQDRAFYCETIKFNKNALLPDATLDEQQRRKLLRSLLEARIIYWKSSIWDIAVNGADIFIGTEIEPMDIPVTPVWWVWEEHGIDLYNHEVQKIEEEDKRIVGVNLLFIPEFSEPAKSPVTRAEIFGFVKERKRWDNLERVGFVHAGRFEIGKEVKYSSRARLLAATRFLKLPFVGTSRMRIAERETRQFKKKKQEPPTIETLLLRRKITDRSEATHRGDVEWSCQWLVGGHWRNQWYPSKQTHAPVWINSYMKGPEDRDFRPPATVIAKVVR